jgi:hypothetical protein
MAAGHSYPVAGGEQGKMRAADADRDRVAGILARPTAKAGCPGTSTMPACRALCPRAPTPTWTMS